MLANQITIKAEYLPSSLNVQADWESRNHKDSSNWKLNPHMFSQSVNIRCVPQIDLFASRLNNQLSKYMFWHPEEPLRVCVPSTLLNRKDTSQSMEGPVSVSHHNTSMTNSAMVHNFTLSVSSASNTSTQSEVIVTRTLRADYTESESEGGSIKTRCNTYQYLITNRPGESGLAGDMNKKLIPIQVL